MGGRTVTERRGMSESERETIARLREIPNVGPAMATDLMKLGVRRLEDVAGRDPDEMYYELCTLDARRHDPCVRDVFAAVVSFADGGPAEPWWKFTPERKTREARNAEMSGGKS
jgi:Pathogenicity locus